MGEKRTDRRIKKTKAAIFQAFAEMLQEKEYSAITVKELTDAADITRKTFYLHYGTLDDMLKEVLSEQLDYLIRKIRNAGTFGGDVIFFSPGAEVEDYVTLFTYLGEMFGERSAMVKKIMRKLMEDTNSRHVIFQVVSERKQLLTQLYQKRYNLNPEAMQLYVSFLMYGTSAMYMEWRGKPGSVTVEAFAGMVKGIISHTHEMLCEWESGEGLQKR